MAVLLLIREHTRNRVPFLAEYNTTKDQDAGPMIECVATFLVADLSKGITTRELLNDVRDREAGCRRLCNVGNGIGDLRRPAPDRIAPDRWRARSRRAGESRILPGKILQRRR